MDVIAMNNHINSVNGQSYAITDYIDSWGCSLADVIEEEYGLSADEFTTQFYDELCAMSLFDTQS